MGASQPSFEPKDVFVGDRGLRSGWRVAVWLPAFVLATVLGGLVGGGAYALLDALGKPLAQGEQFLLLNGLVYLPGLLLVFVFAAFDRERLRSAGVGGPAKTSVFEFWGGTLLGGFFVLPTLLVPWAIGDVRMVFTEPSWSWALIPVWFVGLTIAASWEEVAFRGYGFQWLCRATGHVLVYAVRPIAVLDPDKTAQWLSRAFWILLSSSIFAVMHLQNPNSSGIASLNTFLAGIWLAIAVFRSRALWLACGLHLGWNFTQGPLLGLPISGMGSDESGMQIPSLLSTTLSGPEWATGGGYGVEAGWPCTVVLFFAIAASALWPARKRGDDAPVLRPGAM